MPAVLSLQPGRAWRRCMIRLMEGIGIAELEWVKMGAQAEWKEFECGMVIWLRGGKMGLSGCGAASSNECRGYSASSLHFLMRLFRTRKCARERIACQRVESELPLHSSSVYTCVLGHDQPAHSSFKHLFVSIVWRLTRRRFDQDSKPSTYQIYTSAFHCWQPSKSQNLFTAIPNTCRRIRLYIE